MARRTSALKQQADRREATEGMHFANAAVTLTALPPTSRISLRATPRGAKAFEKHLGFALPHGPADTVSKTGKRHALWLGPDEWLVLDESAPDTSLVPARSNAQFSAVEISHRNVAFSIAGSGAEATLNAGCPRDLSIEAFPVNTASRTIFGKAEVVLYRTGRETFRLECWRSFAPYVWHLLVEGAKDAAL